MLKFCISFLPLIFEVLISKQLEIQFNQMGLKFFFWSTRSIYPRNLQKPFVPQLQYYSPLNGISGGPTVVLLKEYSKDKL